jgi:hypothetical protein
MTIRELRILPPLAIGRLGASKTPLESYELEVSPDEPLGFRRIAPRETLLVDTATGEISGCYVPREIRFRDGAEIRPVAPFLEVFALTADDTLEPLTIELLAGEGLTPSDVRWSVHVANLKAFRRTGKAPDQIHARVTVHDHAVTPLLGECENFLPGKRLPLGSVQYLRPTAAFPEIRLRFTPAAGLVYGASMVRRTSATKTEPDPVFEKHEDRILYDASKPWYGHTEGSDFDPTFTNPAQIYAGYDTVDSARVSWGYLDDECDGIVSVALETKRGTLTAFGRIGAGPPAFAPDSLPIRTVADDLEQALLGPSADAHEVRPAEALEIVRRAFETVRLMNTAVMNGNTVDGRVNVASTMVRQDTADAGRRFEPIMAPSIMDNLAILALHERVYAALRSGTAPWFTEALRRPEEVGDLTDKGRRKMPALMRGADGRYLALTRRQIDILSKVARGAQFEPVSSGEPAKGESK